MIFHNFFRISVPRMVCMSAGDDRYPGNRFFLCTVILCE